MKIPEADRLSVKSLGEKAPLLAGDTSSTIIPKRKRGYHRALKRGAPWAKLQYATNEMMNEAIKFMYKTFDIYTNETVGLSSFLNKDENGK